MNKHILLATVCAAALTGTWTAVPASALAGPSGRYIVVLRPNTAETPDVAAGHARALGGTVTYVYRHALRGFAATLSLRAVERLRQRSYVERITTRPRALASRSTSSTAASG